MNPGLLHHTSVAEQKAEQETTLQHAVDQSLDQPMPISDVVRLHDKVKLLYRVQITKEERLRIQEWRQWVEDAWPTSPGKVYKWLKEDTYQPVILVMRKEGSVTGNIQEMDVVIHQEWAPSCAGMRNSQPRNRTLSLFSSNWGSTHGTITWKYEPISAERLCKQFKRMHRQRATGLDGWTVTDMRNMPWPLLRMLAELLNWIEEDSVWPTRLARGVHTPHSQRGGKCTASTAAAISRFGNPPS